MRTFNILLFLVLAFSLSCKKASEDISLIPNEVKNISWTTRGNMMNMADITFIAAGENVERFSWDFGDGTGLKEGNFVVQKYAKSGKYKVKLFAYGKGGTNKVTVNAKLLKEQEVEIRPEPLPEPDFTFTSNNNFLAPTTIFFNSNSKGRIDEYEYDFGDNNAKAKAQNASYVYNKAGKYKVKLTVRR